MALSVLVDEAVDDDCQEEKDTLNAPAARYFLVNVILLMGGT